MAGTQRYRDRGDPEQRRPSAEQGHARGALHELLPRRKWFASDNAVMSIMTSRHACSRNALLLAIAAIGVSGPGGAARADELQDLKRQIELLQTKVLELEQKQKKTEQKQVAAAADNAVTGGATKGSF